MPSRSPTAGRSRAPARPRDVERAALREEVDTPAIDRRLETKRRAHRLAGRARQPERPDRQVHASARHLRFLRDRAHQLVQRRHLPAREDVGPAGGGRHFAAQPEALDEIVDVRQVIEDPAVAEDDEPAPARRRGRA